MHSFRWRFFFMRLLPFVFVLTLILCHLSPFYLLPYFPFSVQLAFVPVFYFAVFNPKVLSCWAVFLLGVVSDLLTSSVFGVTPFCFVLMYFMANFFRKYFVEFNFFGLWIVFSGVLLMVECINYALVALFGKNPIVFYPVLVEFWIVCLLYPLLMRFCAYLNKKTREVS